MAIATVSGSCGFRRSASSFSANAPFTMAGWIWFASNPITVCEVGIASGTVNGADTCEYTGSGLRGRVRNDAGTVLGTSGFSSLSTGTWHYIAMVRESATSFRLFVNNAWESSPASADISVRSASSVLYSIGESIATSQFITGKLASWKIWTAALTDTELLAEKQYRNPQSNLGSVWATYKFTDNATRVDDASGNSRPLSSRGTWTDDTDPAAILGDDPSPSNAPRSMFYHNFGMR